MSNRMNSSQNPWNTPVWLTVRVKCGTIGRIVPILFEAWFWRRPLILTELTVPIFFRFPGNADERSKLLWDPAGCRKNQREEKKDSQLDSASTKPNIKMAKNNFATGNIQLGTHRCLLFSGRFPCLSIFLDKNFAVGVLLQLHRVEFRKRKILVSSAAFSAPRACARSCHQCTERVDHDSWFTRTFF